MLTQIRQQSLKVQTVFWLTLISLFSFIALFGVNFAYYRYQIMDAQWKQIQSVAELVSYSPLFTNVDDLVENGDTTDDLSGLLTYTNDLISKAEIDGIYIFCQKRDRVFQVMNETGSGTMLNDKPVVSPEVIDMVKKSFYTGQPAKCRVVDSEMMLNYYAQPVVASLTNKYVVCTYVKSLSAELKLMRYAVVNIFSFIVVLAFLDILLIFAANRILVSPIIDIEKMVDSFVYQVSGGYLTFYFKESPGNELLILKNSVTRLEKLIGAHNKLMEESGRYRDWLKKNVDKLGAENQSLNFMLKAAQFDALCDKETCVGNNYAWQKKVDEINHNILAKKVEFLQLVYLLLDDSIDKKEFIIGIMQVLGIDKDIPMDIIFRVSENEFIIVFDKSECPLALIDTAVANSAKISYVTYDKDKHKNILDVLNECKLKLGV